MSWVSTSSGGPRQGPPPASPPITIEQVLPSAGIFASGVEKAFRRAVVALATGDTERCCAELAPHTGSALTNGAFQLVLGFASAKLGRDRVALETLERVVLGNLDYPDSLAEKYLPRLRVGAVVAIVPGVSVEVNMDPAGAALLLAELYQEASRGTDAIELLESLGEEGVEPELIALSLAELYSQAGQWEDVIRVADPDSSADDVSTASLVYRAVALRELGLLDAAHETHTLTLRSRKRAQEVLNFARYERARTYAARGNSRMERKDLETIYATDPGYADVRQRLGLPGDTTSGATE